jgi:DNA repair exonuclease SbcCD ATPase subunit
VDEEKRLKSKENPNPASVTELPVGDGGMEKVRELLFGQQVREIDQQIDQLGEELNARLTDLQAESNREFTSLAEQLKQAQQRLESALAEETLARSNQFETLQSALNEVTAELGNRITATEQALQDEIQRLQSSLEQRIEDVETQLDVQRAELTKALDHEADRLQQAKVERTDLAAMFSTLAQQLQNEH